MLILILNYQKSNMYNKNPCITPSYKGEDAGNYRIKKVFFTAYTLFEARRESQPASGVAIS